MAVVVVSRCGKRARPKFSKFQNKPTTSLLGCTYFFHERRNAREVAQPYRQKRGAVHPVGLGILLPFWRCCTTRSGKTGANPLEQPTSQSHSPTNRAVYQLRWYSDRATKRARSPDVQRHPQKQKELYKRPRRKTAREEGGQARPNSTGPEGRWSWNAGGSNPAQRDRSWTARGRDLRYMTSRSGGIKTQNKSGAH